MSMGSELGVGEEIQDASGLTGVNSLTITPDGRAYAFTYNRSLSDLFLVQGH
jgi:hypothetical protein